MSSASLPVLVHLRWHFQFGQDVISGLVASRGQPPLEIIPMNSVEPLREADLAAVGPCAVIGDSHFGTTWDLCKKRGIPFVDLTGSAGLGEMHRVAPDDRAIGRMAADYLLEAGYMQFAFVGYTDQAYSGRREEGFHEALGIRPIRSYRSLLSPYLLGGPEPALEGFLRELPLPCGIFACSDLRAMSVLACLARLKRKTPEEVAVIGVDADKVLRRISGRSIPSIDQAAWFQGWQAGQLARQLVRRPDMPPASLVMPPIQVIGDEDNRAAPHRHPVVDGLLQALERHYAKPDGLLQALAEVPLSRRSIEAYSRQFLGASPMRMLHRRRLRAALELLAEPGLPIGEIALRTGFEFQGDFSRFIKRILGVSPTVMRQGLLARRA
jgi:LacI family transcriptional regulator